MGLDGYLYRNGPWVDISDYNYIIKILSEMGYTNVYISVNEECWIAYISNDKIMKKIEEEEDWDNASGGMILYFYWYEPEYHVRRKIPWIENPVNFFLIIESLSTRELVLLEFLYRYFEKFPKDAFRIGGDEHCFDKQDINKEYEKKERDKYWLYRYFEDD